ncbi:MAG: hypothetical protein KKD01_04955 [Proteobacteria bacterium]|nr:hypothetical protein [Pseudomonadota bacterium]MBU1454058.1 hypothetical protein [Pseudomonadota bacterium]
MTSVLKTVSTGHNPLTVRLYQTSRKEDDRQWLLQVSLPKRNSTLLLSIPASAGNSPIQPPFLTSFPVRTPG